MSLKIVLPSKGKNVKAGMGTRVYTHDGHEIHDVSTIDVRIRPDELITAVIEVGISEIENLEGVEGIVIQRQDKEETPDDNQ